jgi:hypothetical protein
LILSRTCLSRRRAAFARGLEPDPYFVTAEVTFKDCAELLKQHEAYMAYLKSRFHLDHVEDLFEPDLEEAWERDDRPDNKPVKEKPTCKGEDDHISFMEGTHVAAALIRHLNILTFSLGRRGVRPTCVRLGPEGGGK